jgi:membrane protease YdiL (CAAX protease family)
LYYGLAFGWAWGVWLAAGVLAPQALPLAVLPGAWAPTLSALVVTGLVDGRTGLRELAGRLLRWRVGPGWYGVTAACVAGTVWAARRLFASFGGDLPAMTLPPGVPAEAWPLAVPMVFVINLLLGGPLAEELGWRGFALDKLRARYSGLTSALIVGATWAVWHLPFYWLSQKAVTGGLPFVWFGLLVVAWSVMMAWVYINTGSLLLPVLMHAGANTLVGTLGLLGQGASTPAPVAIYAALNGLAVAAIVVVFGRNLGRHTVTAPARWATSVSGPSAGQAPPASSTGLGR